MDQHEDAAQSSEITDWYVKKDGETREISRQVSSGRHIIFLDGERWALFTNDIEKERAIKLLNGKPFPHVNLHFSREGHECDPCEIKTGDWLIVTYDPLRMARGNESHADMRGWQINLHIRFHQDSGKDVPGRLRDPERIRLVTLDQNRGYQLDSSSIRMPEFPIQRLAAPLIILSSFEHEGVLRGFAGTGGASGGDRDAA